MRPTNGSVSCRTAEASSNPPNDYMSIAARIEACDHPLEARELSEIIGVAKSTIYDGINILGAPNKSGCLLTPFCKR